MASSVLNYEQDVKIDPDALDIEWLNQAALMLRYTKHAAITKQTMDDCKERLDFTKAELEMDIRTKPEAYGLAKVTEAGIQSAILLQEKYQILMKEYASARYEYDIANGAVRAIDQKKTALENLVKLLGQSYFAGPKAPRNLYQEQLDQTARREANAKVKITRTRKGGS